MAACSQVNIPVLNTEADPCNGRHISTKCVFHESPIVSLSIGSNTNISEIISAMAIAIKNNNNKILQLESQLVQQSELIALLEAQVDACCQ